MKRLLIAALLVITLGTTAAANVMYPVADEVYTILNDAGYGDV